MTVTMVKYSTLHATDSTIVYFDENERKDSAGQPSFGIFDWILLIFIHLVWILSLPLTFCCSFKIIPKFERVIVYRLGRILPLQGPGLIALIPFIDRTKRVDMRMRAFKVPPQEIMTIDNGVLKIGADVQYRYVNPILTQTIQDLDHSLRVTGQVSLTSLVSTEELQFVKNENHQLQQRLQTHMNKVVSAWGIEIGRFEIKESIVIKERGGITPSHDQEEHDGAAAIMNLIKSVVSPDNHVLPGMYLPNNSTPSQSSSGKAQPMGGTLLTPRELFSIAKGVIDESLCVEINAIYQFCITQSDGQVNKWTVDVKNRPGFVKEGESNCIPDVIFTMSNMTFQQIFHGQISPKAAYLNNTLSLSGSTNIAIKLEILINRLKSF